MCYRTSNGNMIITRAVWTSLSTIARYQAKNCHLRTWLLRDFGLTGHMYPFVLDI